jgi:hypothetical protein
LASLPSHRRCMPLPSPRLPHPAAALATFSPPP